MIKIDAYIKEMHNLESQRVMENVDRQTFWVGQVLGT